MIRFAAVLSVLIVPACFSLPKVDVIRVIDDFAEDAGLAPTWNVFEPWTCGPYIDPGQTIDAGQDAGIGDGNEAGQAVACTLGFETGADLEPPPFPGAVTHALVASFTLTTPYDVDVATRIKSGAIDGGDALTPLVPVNLTGFSQLLFNAKLLPSGTTQLPTGTELHVELRCSSTNDPLVDQNVMLMPGVVNWRPISLPFSNFTVASQRQTCLAAVDSIGFVVVPGSVPAGTQVVGTLQLDDIRLQ